MLRLNGALTSRVYQFQTRPWDLKTTKSYEINTLEYSAVIVNFKGKDIARVLPTSSNWLTNSSRYFFKNFLSQLNFIPKLPLFGLKNKYVDLSITCSINFLIFVFKNFRKINNLNFVSHILMKRKAHLNNPILIKLALGSRSDLKTGIVLQNVLKKIFGFFELSFGNNQKTNINDNFLLFNSKTSNVPTKFLSERLPVFSLNSAKDSKKSQIVTLIKKLIKNKNLVPKSKDDTFFSFRMVQFFLNLQAERDGMVKNSFSKIVQKNLVNSIGGYAYTDCIGKKFRTTNSAFFDIFKGGLFNIDNVLLSERIKEDFSFGGNIDLTIVNSIKKNSSNTNFNPLFSQYFEQFLNFSNSAKCLILLPTHLYYSQEFSNVDFLGKRKMQRHSQIVYLPQASELKSASLVLSTLLELIVTHRVLNSDTDELLLVMSQTEK